MAAKEVKLIHKIFAVIGIILLGIGSFVSCLSLDSFIANIGNALMIIGIGISWYGFLYWKP
ncbi:hypothetical protein [Brachyspira hampsonii]|uniref:Uncharacterized protein n=1 Tax=Brachyspira hampsonii TaxID=1287055 RepID=A0AAC9TSN8_9SPIR|nr:hypothetical protein [Brachyspira hampsonii]ASJ22640.1 hypothetical protein BHAMNSH16_13700 [Brachyspira hampsonii]ELV04798.1 hypothetical protein H263_14065 [Brachyspira hampsonii 30599]MBW5379282.1 hypothetical protein [Brachyspira hampsonii]MBW5409859.1 hypothetical protein [Brachyspira hampsonii]OEJ19335.1 hypothetical protein A9496_04455 [Brachyspira hampsonii]